MTNKLVSRQLIFNSQRCISTSSVYFGNDLQKVKPFTDIPNLSAFKMISRSIPGGKYYKISLIDIHSSIRKEFGDIVRFPAMLGRPAAVITYKPEDFEKVKRNSEKITLCLSFHDFRFLFSLYRYTELKVYGQLESA